MATDWTRKASPGTLAPKCRLMPSLGWMRSTRALGRSWRASSPSKARKGTLWNCRATSVTRAGSRLPVRT